jgi:O-glycosyl hydrolase
MPSHRRSTTVSFMWIEHWRALVRGDAARRWSAIAPILLLLGFGCLLLVVRDVGAGTRAQQAESVSISVDGSLTFQTIDGFGATTQSLVYGTRDNLSPDLRARAIDAVYNQVRISLGTAGSLLESPAGFPERRNDDGDPLTVNWRGFSTTQVDALKRSVVDPASAYGFTGTFLGPTVNTRWASPWLASLRGTDYERYLDEAAEQVLATQIYWRDTLGVTPRYHMLFNEPTSGNGELQGGNERDIVDIVKRAGDRLQRAGFTDVKFVVPSEETEQGSFTSARAVLSDPDARAYVGAIAYHPYPYGSVYASVPRILATSGAGAPDASRLLARQQLRDLARSYGVQLWMTEVSHGEVDARAYEGLRGRAIHIHDELVYADAAAYFGMLTMWDTTAHREHFQGNTNIFTEEGTIVLIEQGTGTIYITGMGYAIGHYARWIRRGAVRLDVATGDPLVLASAFRDAANNGLVIVLINNAPSERPVTVRLSNVELAGALAGEQSTREAYWRRLPDVTPFDATTASINLPPESVTTLGGPFVSP